MRKVAVLLLLISVAGFSQSEKTDQLLIAADSLKSTDELALDSVINQLLIEAKESKNEDIASIALIKKVESLLLFNHFIEADSVLNSIEASEDIGLPYLDYLMATGQILGLKQKNDLALETFYNLLDLNTREGTDHKVAETYLEIANVLRGNNDLDNCTKYFRFAMNKAAEQGNTSLQIKACTQLCKVYNGWITLDLDSSVYYGEKAIAIAKSAEDEYGYVQAISIVPAPIIRAGGYRRGIEMSKEALGYADQYNFPLRTRFYLTANLGFGYEELKMYDSALYFMKEAGDLRPTSIDYPRLKYRVFKAQGRFEEALAALEEYREKQVEVIESRSKTNLSSLQARFEANQKEQEVLSLTQKAKLQTLQLSQQRYILIGLGIVFVLLTLTGVLLYRQRKLKEFQRITNLELEEAQKRLEVEKQFRASELKALRSQMNPHFVFNALNSIQEYIMTNERKLAGKYLGKFADLMRIYLDHSRKSTVTVSEEVEALSLYLELEKLRFEDSLHYKIDLDEDVDISAPIPSILLQPYVENAIKHGLLHKKDNRNIEVLITQKEDMLQCEIVDNGIGRKKSGEINKMRNPNHKSFATTATQSRIELLNRDRKLAIEEQVMDMDENDTEFCGTRVLLKIPA